MRGNLRLSIETEPIQALPTGKGEHVMSMKPNQIPRDLSKREKGTRAWNKEPLTRACICLSEGEHGTEQGTDHLRQHCVKVRGNTAPC